VFTKYFYIQVVVLLIFGFKSYSQEENLNLKIKDTIFNTNDFNPLSPAKAAFYSAILPGLGQAYNKKYWKIPFVYGAIGTGIYFYDSNNKNYNRARTAYKLRINDKPDEFDGTNGNILLSDDALIRAQKSYKKDRDLSLLVTIGIYFLQIIEASTNAHLLQHNVDDNLSFSPQIIQNSVTNKSIVGASINFNF
jgi:exopolysaccharide biosynthesis protein